MIEGDQTTVLNENYGKPELKSKAVLPVFPTQLLSGSPPCLVFLPSSSHTAYVEDLLLPFYYASRKFNKYSRIHLKLV